jgi:tRNA G18 (ribose-2'-O)-methylase SpoU
LQLNHYNTNFKKKDFPIILVSENVTNAPNIGSLLRISDAFGIQKLILCGENIPLGRKMTKTSRATEKSVNFELKPSALEVVQAYKKEGFKIIALEITSQSTPIHLKSFSINDKIALVIGDENFGISESILNISDSVVHIEMYGQNSSMNVVQATNIALYEITKQLL